MLIAAAQTLLSLVLLYLGGECLVRGAAGLAVRLGVSTLAIGLTVVAFGTSAPEFVVSVDAALAGANDIAVGNVVGSNIANIALILGLSCLLKPCLINAKIVRIDAPVMIATSLALLAILANGAASRIEGAALVACLAAFVVSTFRTGHREIPTVQEELSAATPERILAAGSSLALVCLGLAMLVGGGHLLVDAAVELAGALGTSEALIGLTIVAVGTSLPEFATTVLASLRGQGDIAVGNVIGSNIFNVLGILGIAALISPLSTTNVGWPDLLTMLLFACVVMVMVSTRQRLGRVEGAILLAGYVAYTTWRVAA